MPCDQQITTSVVELTKVNRDRLAVVLGELKWTATVRDGVLTAYGPRGEQLRVTATEARLTTSAYTADSEAILTTIRQAYAARTVQDVSRRFGFKAAGTQTMANGAKRLVLRR
jgi:hypothetical protein